MAVNTMTTREFFQANSSIVMKLYSNSTPMEPIVYPELFNDWDFPEDRSFATVLSIAGFGVLQERTEGALPAVDVAREAARSSFAWTTYALRYFVSKEAMREDPKSLIPKLPGLLRYSSDQTKEFLIWSILNFAFNPAVPLAVNGLPLISANIPCAANPAVTFSNLLLNVGLSVDALQAAIDLMAIMPDDRGVLLTSKTPRKLVFPTYLRKQATQTLQSFYYPGTSQNDVNPVAGVVDPLAVKYITAPFGGPYPWFVTAGKGELGTDAHALFASVKWDEQEAHYDEDRKGMVHETEFRIMYDAVEQRGIVGSQG
jgi:hypothetical protein